MGGLCSKPDKPDTQLAIPPAVAAPPAMAAPAGPVHKFEYFGMHGRGL